MKTPPTDEDATNGWKRHEWMKMQRTDEESRRSYGWMKNSKDNHKVKKEKIKEIRLQKQTWKSNENRVGTNGNYSISKH